MLLACNLDNRVEIGSIQYSDIFSSGYRCDTAGILSILFFYLNPSLSPVAYTEVFLRSFSRNLIKYANFEETCSLFFEQLQRVMYVTYFRDKMAKEKKYHNRLLGKRGLTDHINPSASFKIVEKYQPASSCAAVRPVMWPPAVKVDMDIPPT